MELGKMLEEAGKWERKHGAKFEQTKYELVHFTRNNRTEISSTLIVMTDGFTIKSLLQARYLLS
jgi:hypothetical protein